MTDNIGALVNTMIPSLTDDADIMAAFRMYHYGSDTYNVNNTDESQIPANSIAARLLSFAPKASPTFTGTATIPTLSCTTATIDNLGLSTAITTDLNLASAKVFKINGTTVLTPTQILGKTIGQNSASSIVTLDATQTLTNKTINASQLVDASVTNAKLANPSVSFGSTQVSLGDTVTTLDVTATNATKAASYSGGFTKITVSATAPSSPSAGDVWIKI